jgi:alpha-mannosidase
VSRFCPLLCHSSLTLRTAPPRLEQDYPLLFNKIKGRIESGEFQPIGGTWVEMDTNMPSGEALCRQFLYGQRYYKSRFGKYTRTFW